MVAGARMALGRDGVSETEVYQENEFAAALMIINPCTRLAQAGKRFALTHPSGWDGPKSAAVEHPDRGQKDAVESAGRLMTLSQG